MKQNVSETDIANIPKLNQGHDIVYSLEWQDHTFLRTILNHKIVFDILKSSLNDSWYKQLPAELPNFILRAMIARSGGSKRLPLHIDSFIPNAGKLSFLMQVALILEDQTIENGCTFCLPGSHKWDHYADNLAYNDELVPIESKAGDIIIWDSRLHHGAFENTTASSRWSVIATFSRWWIKQNYQTDKNLKTDFISKLTTEEKIVLGLCSLPPLNVHERVDIKAD